MNPSTLQTFVSFLPSSTTPGFIAVEDSYYAMGANETYQSNPVDNAAYTSQVGSTPPSYISLNADASMTVYYDTSSDAQNWTNAVATYSYTTTGAAITYANTYPGVEYVRYRVVNGSTPATTTSIEVGLKHG